ncbi:MAG: redoxin domain-containing protein [Acidobacteriaceae bacterium]|nr:redoxin domain-containing protein [Acidobacteriaceae bacterium]MBV8569701.1 redoxin domain-containing protein [Acidobacteriaceae bacterium]
MTIYDFNLPDIDGKMVALTTFKGKVLLIVNVADGSNYTPQFAELEKVYQTYKGQGFVVLAFPSNDFGGEEPENEQQIKSFCEKNYHLTFPIFAKIPVRGDDATPLFRYLSKEANPELKGAVHWNFTKFVIDRKGALTARFEPPVSPDDPEVLVAIENALSGKKQTSPSKDGKESKENRADR